MNTRHLLPLTGWRRDNRSLRDFMIRQEGETMLKMTEADYIARRDECIAAAAKAVLPLAKQRQMDAADAWQKLIEKLASDADDVKVRLPDLD